jgi:heat shock protein HtpX
MKRIGLFLMTNLLVIGSISILVHFLKIQPYITKYGINLQALMIICLIWGMTGSFISLLFSRIIAKSSMKVHVVDPLNPKNQDEVELISIVYKIAKKAGLKKMPEVGIYYNPEVNAFATGPTKNRSLVAVSSGLLEFMNRNEFEAIIGHEISHIANGDMVTMTLLQGIVNSFVMFLARVIAFLIVHRGKEEEFRPGILYFIIVFIMEIILMFFGMIVVSAFSRYREYKADAGGANLTDSESMISALNALRNVDNPVDKKSPLATFKVFGTSTLFGLFSTHPSLENRIKRLKNK